MSDPLAIEQFRELVTPSALGGVLAQADAAARRLGVDGATPAARAAELDRIAAAAGSFCITDAAKVLGVPPRALLGRLLGLGWIVRRPGSRRLICAESVAKVGYVTRRADHRRGAYVTAAGVVQLAAA